MNNPQEATGRGVTGRCQVARPAWAVGVARFWNKNKWGYFFVLPALVFFIVFFFVPIVWAFLLSFQDATPFGGRWVGLANYRSLLKDEVFRVAVRNTTLYTSIVVAQNIFVSLAVASLIQSLSARLRTFFRAAFYLPAVTSAVMIALVWRWIFNSEWGFLNFLLGIVHLAPVRWLSDPDVALWSIILSSLLTVPATGVVMYSAALGSIPVSYYEAASLDGAGTLAKWWYITVPLIKPTTLYLLVVYTIWAFQVFEKVYVMTGGGPGWATTTIVQLIYNTGFRDWKFGMAAAQGMILFAVIALVAVIQFRYLNTDVEY